MCYSIFTIITDFSALKNLEICEVGCFLVSLYFTFFLKIWFEGFRKLFKLLIIHWDFCLILVIFVWCNEILCSMLIYVMWLCCSLLSNRSFTFMYGMSVCCFWLYNWFRALILYWLYHEFIFIMWIIICCHFVCHDAFYWSSPWLHFVIFLRWKPLCVHWFMNCNNVFFVVCSVQTCHFLFHSSYMMILRWPCQFPSSKNVGECNLNS
jgi:hypothetical protein